MNESRTTIKDIARECGVSLSTVSLVLNDNPRISERTREKVQEAVRRHSYQPNQQARGLASKSSSIMSVVVPNLKNVFSDIYFGEILSGIHEQATAGGYKLLLDVANEQFERNQDYINIIRSRRADGMLFIASSTHDSYLRGVGEYQLPFLLVNHYYPTSKLNFVALDYKASAQVAANHLIALGHKRIGLIAGVNTYTGLDFRDAFLAHCRQNGLSEADLPWENGGEHWNQEGGLYATQRLLERQPGCTAIMAANDRMAIGAISYLRGRGLRVPEDVSVMGVDDIPTAPFTTPPLTTIRHDLFEVGRRSFDKVLALFKNEITECHEILPVALMERESTGPARPA
jgi:DNA-binding LacI/PurR family transcriptional regulator